MKKRVIFYTIYCCLVIAILAGFLMYKVEAKSNEEPANRAESIILNTPREITVPVNRKIKLLDGFITVEPENAIDLMTFSISASSTTSEENIEFDISTNTFITKKVGYYYIKFSVPKNAFSNLSDTLKIHAVNNYLDFKLLTNQIEIGKSKAFDEIFEKQNVFDYSVNLLNDNFTFENDYFYANKLGSTTIDIEIKRDYVCYTNEYVLYSVENTYGPHIPDSETGGQDSGDVGGDVEQKPNNKLEIKIVDENFVNARSVYVVQYQILFGNNEWVSQEVKAQVRNSTIAEIIECNAPFIRIKILKSGRFTLTLSLAENPEVSISVEISVILENEKT